MGSRARAALRMRVTRAVPPGDAACWGCGCERQQVCSQTASVGCRVVAGPGGRCRWRPGPCPPCRTPAPAGSGSPCVSSVPCEPGDAWTLCARRLLDCGNFPCTQCVGPGPVLALSLVSWGHKEGRGSSWGVHRGGSLQLGAVPPLGAVSCSPQAQATLPSLLLPLETASPRGHPGSGTGGSTAGSPEVSL